MIRRERVRDGPNTQRRVGASLASWRMRRPRRRGCSRSARPTRPGRRRRSPPSTAGTARARRPRASMTAGPRAPPGRRPTRGSRRSRRRRGQRDVAERGRVDQAHGGPQSERQQLQGDGGVQGLNRLRRIGDDDEPVRRPGHDLLPGVAPPPPLTSQPSGEIWSAPSMVMSNRSMLVTSSIRMPSSRAACSVRGDVAAQTMSRDRLASAGSRYATVEPVPSPTVMPFSTSSAAASAATCFSRSTLTTGPPDGGRCLAPRYGPRSRTRAPACRGAPQPGRGSPGSSGGTAVTMSAISATTMALRAHARGGPEPLVYEEAPTPGPPRRGPGRGARCRDHLAELTWDLSWTTRDGGDRTPIIPSHEVSGIVVGLGRMRWRSGRRRGLRPDRLRPRRGGGAVRHASRRRPRGQTPIGLHTETATLPLAALTAWQALVDHAGLNPGDRVLVQGGAGAWVATSSSSRSPWAARDRYRPRRAARLRPRARRACFRRPTPGPGDHLDQVSPADGFATCHRHRRGRRPGRLLRDLRRGGRLVTLSAPPDSDKAAAHGLRAVLSSSGRTPPSSRTWPRWSTTGSCACLQPTFPLQDGRAAFESAIRRIPPGKTVLIVRTSRPAP